MKRLTCRLKDQLGNPTDSIILEPYMRYEDKDTKNVILNHLAAYEDTGLTPEEFKESVDFVLNLNAKLHNVANYLIKEYTNKYEYYDTDSYWNNGAVEALEELLRRLHE